MYCSLSHEADLPILLCCRTIKEDSVEAKKILGSKLYLDLDKMILDLMDGSTFLTTAMANVGPTTISGWTNKGEALNEDHFNCRHRLPPFTGKYYHEIFGMKHDDD